jgi:hypothetical protein
VSTLELVPTDRLAQKCSSGGRFSSARRVRSCARGQSDTSYSARHLRGDASFHGDGALSPAGGRAHGSRPERRASMRFRDARSSKEQRRGVRCRGCGAAPLSS